MNSSEILDYLRQMKPRYTQKGVKRLGLFGSFAKGQADEYSDIDLLIGFASDFPDADHVWDYFTIQREIKEDIAKRFGRRVELLDADSISSLGDQILQEVIDV